MATAREPSRRYASVEQFAGDLRRHLQHQPVAARAATWRYTADRFIRRNRVAVAAAAVAVLGLAIGLGLALWQGYVAQQARAAAERRFGELRTLTNALVFDYHDAIKELPGSTEVRAALLRDGLRSSTRWRPRQAGSHADARPERRLRAHRRAAGHGVRRQHGRHSRCDGQLSQRPRSIRRARRGFVERPGPVVALGQINL